MPRFMRASGKTITVAAGQVTARLMNEAEQTLASLSALIAEAGAMGVQILVLPECAYPAYLLGSVASYRAADHLGSEAFVRWLRERSARYRLHIVSGFVEDTGACVHNAAVLIDDEGHEIGRCRKRFLWHADRGWFAPGDEIRAFDTKVGRLGIVICAETRAPEIVATLAAAGAELLAMPTCWINGSRQPGQYTNPQLEFIIAARAREFGIPFVCADKAGLELPPVGYVGQSRIVLADGSVAATAPPEGDALVPATVELGRPRRAWMNDRQRRRILSEQKPERPPAASRTVTVAAVPTPVVEERLAGGMGEALFKPLREAGVEVAMLNVTHENQAERLRMYARAFDIHAVTYPDKTGVTECGPARVGCVTGQWMGFFAGARALTLDGAQILMCFDVPDDIALLQTRAVENRVFIIGANAIRGLVIDPNGTVLADSLADAPAGAIATIDLAEAADKLVAPETDILNERRVALYRF